MAEAARVGESRTPWHGACDSDEGEGDVSFGAERSNGIIFRIQTPALRVVKALMNSWVA